LFVDHVCHSASPGSLCSGFNANKNDAGMRESLNATSGREIPWRKGIPPQGGGQGDARRDSGAARGFSFISGVWVPFDGLGAAEVRTAKSPPDFAGGLL
jgi:hypothetical protein